MMALVGNQRNNESGGENWLSSIRGKLPVGESFGGWRRMRDRLSCKMKECEVTTNFDMSDMLGQLLFFLIFGDYGSIFWNSSIPSVGCSITTFFPMVGMETEKLRESIKIPLGFVFFSWRLKTMLKTDDEISSTQQLHSLKRAYVKHWRVGFSHEGCDTGPQKSWGVPSQFLGFPGFKLVAIPFVSCFGAFFYGFYHSSYHESSPWRGKMVNSRNLKQI